MNGTEKKQLDNKEFIPKVAELINEGHTVTINLRGFSMRPFLEDRRDKAVLKVATTINNGDVVLAQISPGRYALHRVININGDTITMRGDGNLTTEQCTKSDVCGKAVCFYRKGRNTPDRTDGMKWKIYSAIWTRLFPIRRYLLFVYRLWHKVSGIQK